MLLILIYHCGFIIVNIHYKSTTVKFYLFRYFDYSRLEHGWVRTGILQSIVP